MLILSGITIVTLTGENGMINKVRLTKQITEVSSEKEAIQLNITLAKMENILDNSNKYYIGIPLYDKNLENGNKWNIIVKNKTQTIYGTGWNYIEKGTEINNYGKTKNSWIVNYESGNIEQLEEDEYTQLMYGSNLAVRDGIILNVDPINMSDSTSWGQNVKLYGVKDGDGYGWNGTEINFDGIDDYIEIYNSFEMNEGITFEFYGRSENDIMMLSKTIVGEKEHYSTKFRTKFLKSGDFRCCMSRENSQSDWKLSSDYNGYHWIRKGGLKKFDGEDGGYIAMTVNLNTNIITLYQDGDFIGSTQCSDKWLRNGSLTDNTVPFTIGLLTEGDVYSEKYSKMSLYSCRLYNKVLDEKEIKENYNKTTAYHNMIVNQ